VVEKANQGFPVRSTPHRSLVCGDPVFRGDILRERFVLYDCGIVLGLIIHPCGLDIVLLRSSIPLSTVIALRLMRRLVYFDQICSSDTS
jgi:hypothetical protein